MKVIITKRASDFHACIEGEPNCWDCGRTPDEALGALIRTHPKRFDIEVVEVDR